MMTSVGRRKPAAIIAAGVTAAVLMTGLAPAANADVDSNMDGGEAVAVVEELAPTVDLVPADELTQVGDTLIVDGGETEISADAAQGTDLELPGGLEINIAPIADRGHGEGEIVDGQAVTPVGEDQVVVTQATEEGARMIGILETAEASTAIDYSIDLPSNVALIPTEDGGLTIAKEKATQAADGSTLIESFAVGEVEAPWAVDAEGSPIPTHFVYNETTGTLTQVVTPTAETVFPVAADPAWRITTVAKIPVKAEVWFTRGEMERIAYSATPETVIGIAAKSGNPYVVGVAIALSVAIVVTAANVHRDGQCIKLTWTPTINVWSRYGAKGVCTPA